MKVGLNKIYRSCYSVPERYMFLQHRTLYCFLLLMTGMDALHAQPPSINYGDYKLFIKGTPIIPFAPKNLGGAIPKEIYSRTVTYSGKNQTATIESPGINSTFNHPSKLAVDKIGNVFVCDEGNHSIRKISPEGRVTTITNNLHSPSGIAVDQLNNIYVADVYEHQILKILPSGVIIDLAGNGKPGSIDANKGNVASFSFPVDLAVDPSGNLYVVDEGNNKIRKISPAGAVTTFAGSGIAGDQDDTDGLKASFNQPNGIAVDRYGNIYVADQLNHKIRMITPNGAVSSIAGSGMAGSADNLIGSMASFNHPRGVAVDQVGNVFVADAANQKIRKITPEGAVSTLSGTGASGSQDSDIGLMAGFHFPNGVAIDSSGNLFVADYLNNKIRKISTNGYSITPEMLPGGIFFDKSSGVFSGTPREIVNSRRYQINGYNSYGSSTTNLNISVSSQPGNALNFDGLDDRVYIPDAQDLRPKTVSIEMWVKIKKLDAGFGRILVKRNAMGSYDDSYSIGVDSLNHIIAVVCSGDGKKGSQYFAKQKGTYEADRWYYIAAVFRSDSIKLYINDHLEAVTSTGFPLSHSENAMILGFDDRLAFTIDELRIFNTDRSDKIIADRYESLPAETPGLVAYYNFNSGIADGQNLSENVLVDISGNGHNGVLSNFQLNQGNRSNWTESYAMMVPNKIELYDVTKDACTIKWKDPMIGETNGYLLDVSENTDFSSFVEGYHAKKIMGNETLISGLHSDKNYYLRISAENSMLKEIGGYSDIIKVHTKE